MTICLLQAIDGDLRRSLCCQIKLPTFSGWEVPKWFHYRKEDVCELLIEIPHNLLRKSIGMVVGVIIEITQAHSPSRPRIEVTLDGIPIFGGSYTIFDQKFSGYHMCLKYIGLENLWKQQVDKRIDQSLPQIFRAAFRDCPLGVTANRCSLRVVGSIWIICSAMTMVMMRRRRIMMIIGHIPGINSMQQTITH
ncbi:hypothetical protein M0R45_020300 [Rubus argutus]|uniref:C-JID domain-containing protein n=1 Tax=Rubus argutus TaxID=59490 RepID=A0AAW1X7W7_RUBAR